MAACRRWVAVGGLKAWRALLAVSCRRVWLRQLAGQPHTARLARMGATRHSSRPLCHSVALQGQCLGRAPRLNSSRRRHPRVATWMQHHSRVAVTCIKCHSHRMSTWRHCQPSAAAGPSTRLCPCSSRLLGGRNCLQLPHLDPLPLYNSFQKPNLPHQVPIRLTRCKLSKHSYVDPNLSEVSLKSQSSQLHMQRLQPCSKYVCSSCMVCSSEASRRLPLSALTSMASQS